MLLLHLGLCQTLIPTSSYLFVHYAKGVEGLTACFILWLFRFINGDSSCFPGSQKIF